MLTLVIAEAALELVPASLVGHPVIVKSAKKRGKPPEKMLLDSNFHHAAMHGLKDSKRRGRPDIVHIVLLCALESVLNKKGGLHLYIHTRDDDIIYVDSKTRIPRSYNRFCGLIEQLFEKRSVKNLLDMKRQPLLTFLEELSGEKMVMEQGGDAMTVKKDAVCVIGGFSHGDFLTRFPYGTYEVCAMPLPAWTVVNELIVRYELL